MGCVRDLFIAAAEGRPIALRSTGASIANVIASTAKPSDVTDLNARAFAGKVSTICGESVWIVSLDSVFGAYLGAYLGDISPTLPTGIEVTT